MTDTVIDSAERPAHRRSLLWDYADRIRELLAQGRSYTQIVRMLRLPVTSSRLGKWARRRGMSSLAPSRHARWPAEGSAQAPQAPLAPDSPQASPVVASPAAAPAPAGKPPVVDLEAALFGGERKSPFHGIVKPKS